MEKEGPDLPRKLSFLSTSALASFSRYLSLFEGAQSVSANSSCINITTTIHVPMETLQLDLLAYASPSLHCDVLYLVFLYFRFAFPCRLPLFGDTFNFHSAWKTIT